MSKLKSYAVSVVGLFVGLVMFVFVSGISFYFTENIDANTLFTGLICYPTIGLVFARLMYLEEILMDAEKKI